MKPRLQLKWTDETEWKDIRALEPGESAADAIRNAERIDAAASEKYRHHTFHAEFRVV